MIKQPELRARCTQEELLALIAVAEREHLKPTETLRQLVRQAAKQIGAWPPAAVLADGDGSEAHGD
jgi:hypothetical protein